MAWFTRFTRFGDVHLVYGQEAGNSCGIASIMMCVFKINKLTPGSTAVTVEKDIYKKYEAAMGGGYVYTPETVGTYPEKLATILNSFTTGNWKWHQTPVNDVGQVLTDQVGVRGMFGPSLDVNPVILGVDWDTTGAHWVVVDTIRDVLGTRYATVCDPWDSNVHMQKFATGSPFVYDPNSGGFTIDFWGKHKDYTSNSAKGQVKTWGMIYRD
jgi:hypothetical protein